MSYIVRNDIVYHLLHTSFSVNGYVRAYDSLKTMCNEVCLLAPHRITSVSMRKYMATLTQVFYCYFLLKCTCESVNDFFALLCGI